LPTGTIRCITAAINALWGLVRVGTSHSAHYIFILSAWHTISTRAGKGRDHRGELPLHDDNALLDDYVGL
jgi:hypothetical protein